MIKYPNIPNIIAIIIRKFKGLVWVRYLVLSLDLVGKLGSNLCNATLYFIGGS